jgi:hypothetical protein
LGQKKTGIFLQRGLDKGIGDLPDGQNYTIAPRSLVGVRPMPAFQIVLRNAGFLFFLDGPLPGLVGLLGVFPIRALAGIVVRFLFAHGARPPVWPDAASASLADAFDLFIDLRILRILRSNGVVARHRGP